MTHRNLKQAFSRYLQNQFWTNIGVEFKNVSSNSTIARLHCFPAIGIIIKS
jgi:hypothetical protein